MTKNFDTLLKNCLTEMQQAAQDPSKDPLIQNVVANMNNPELRKVIEDALKKIQQAQAKQTPPANQTQPKPASQQNQPQTQQPSQQQPNNAANKPA